MSQPAAAPVKPRFLSSITGSALPIEDEVSSWLNDGRSGVVWLSGGAGSGKTTALAHLAAVLPQTSAMRLIDEGDFAKCVERWKTDELVICAAHVANASPSEQSLTLAPWGRDEFVEYLLATHPDQCHVVMSRISSEDEQVFEGVPEVWRAILDELIDDPSLPDARQALAKHLRSRLEAFAFWESAQLACLDWQCGKRERFPGLDVHHPPEDRMVLRLLRHEPVQCLLAAEYLTQELRGEVKTDHLDRLVPRDVVLRVAARIASDVSVVSRLKAAMKIPQRQAMAASFLHFAEPSWQPVSHPGLNLEGAYLDSVAWQGIGLRKANLRFADLTAAILRQANLENACLDAANLSAALLCEAFACELSAVGADLSDADLSSIHAERAQFDRANLTGATLDDAWLSRAGFIEADLRGASFSRAKLNRARLFQARIEGADFSKADLSGAILFGLPLREAVFDGACFRGADMTKCDFEGMQLKDVDLSGADLEGALLTATSISGGNFTQTDLQNTGLAEIEWEGACLRNADLRGATFHMGSSRSGLVGSPIACEGSRTGFYTDDYTDQDYKAPEEIRKANLCRADLRGAKIEGVDFYLVDLRGALYDAEQADHLRRCGAILEDRCAR